MIPASRSRRRVERVRRSIGSSTSTRPLRGWPSESNAPALASDSIVRLFSTRRVDAVAEVVEVGERPALLAGGDDQRDDALADVADRRQAEADRLAAVVGADAHGEVLLRLVDVGDEHGDVRAGGTR